MTGNGFVIAFNGAFIATIGVWAAETSGHKKISGGFKIIGGIFIIIGIIIAFIS